MSRPEWAAAERESTLERSVLRLADAAGVARGDVPELVRGLGLAGALRRLVECRERRRRDPWAMRRELERRR